MGNDNITAHTFFLLLFFFLLLLFLSFISVLSSSSTTETVARGRWELLQSSIGISAMHMQLLHTDQVIIFDRTDFGSSNLSLPRTTRCRRDPNDFVLKSDCTAHSLVYDVHTNTIRPLKIQTDTWCSSGAVLPNGTLFQSGGFNDGERVVRFVSPGSHSDWVEFPKYLNVRRWYATNQILADGNVIIVGGRNEFSYEFFPKQKGSSTGNAHDFPFLRETSDRVDENNLYPFVHLLPDGSLFVFANTKSIIFDHVNNLVVRTLPSIPGEEPRNYPSTGSSVLLPLRLPTDGSDRVDAEVLVCGGAPVGSHQLALNGTFLPAVRTCGRLVVTDPDAVWRTETMPMARVMGDMVILPSSDVIIINGAGSGTAGWELGREPVTTPVLYRTSVTPNRRFQVLNRANIPRLYHSTAILDSRGRILVGGSNPHVYNDFADVLYPTELSLEAFHPPYLDERFDDRRPHIHAVGPGNVVLYSQPIWVRFGVREYRPELGVTVVVLAPPFTTHSLGMNQRMVVLVVDLVSSVGQSTYQINTRVPPTARIAPPGYYMLFVVHAGVPSTCSWIRIH